MVASKGVVAALTAAAIGVAWLRSEPAQAGGSGTPSYLLFSGTNIWRFGAFLYGGLLWSPGGLDNSGFTFKSLLSTGDYSYYSGGLDQNINGAMFSAAMMPGWHFRQGGLNVSVFAGPTLQDYRLTPADPGSRLQGLYFGAQFGADIWYEPTAATMVAVNGGVASIGPTGYLHGAFGYRLFAPAFVGPKTQAFWCGEYDEFQFGVHVTGLHVDAFSWSAGAGWGLTSDNRSSPYLHFGVETRY